jgi:hypothetical protein
MKTDSKVIQEAIDNCLGTPVFIGFSEHILKLRRNLVAISIGILLYKSFGVKIENIFGISCKGVPIYKIDLALLLYLSYNCIHYAWDGYETFLRWKIRTSGTFKNPIPPITNTGSQAVTVDQLDADSALKRAIRIRDIGYGNGEQSYLYSLIAQAVNNNLSKINTSISTDASNAIDEKYLALKGTLEMIRRGLENFEKSFYSFQKTQWIRFLVIDFIIPLVLFAWAWCWLIYSISTSNNFDID